MVADASGPYFYNDRLGTGGSSAGLNFGFPVSSCENHCLRLCWHGHAMAAVTSDVI